MSLTADELQTLLDTFEVSSWQELDLHVGSTALHLLRQTDAPSDADGRRSGDADAGSAGPPESRGGAPAESETAGSRADIAVKAPSVGVIRLSPDARSPAFVTVGSRVGPSQAIARLEVHRTAAPIPAGTAGVITAVLVEDGDSVEYGDAVVLLKPDV